MISNCLICFNKQTKINSSKWKDLRRVPDSACIDYVHALGGSGMLESPAWLQSRIKFADTACFRDCCARLYHLTRVWRTNSDLKRGRRRRFGMRRCRIAYSQIKNTRVRLYYLRRQGWGQIFHDAATKILSEAFRLFRRMKKSNILRGILSLQLLAP